MDKELFEKMPIPKAYMKMALPVMFSNVLMIVYNMVDMYFIGRTGNTDLVAGVSLCGPVFTALIACGDIFGLGTGSVISRLFGAAKYDDGKRLSVFAAIGSFLFGIAAAALLLIGKNPLLSLLGANADTLPYAGSYFTWIAVGAPFIIFSLVPTNLLRTEGKAKDAMIGSVLGSIANMILDPIFIFTFGLGAAGAAIATVLGNILADIFYVFVITKKAQNLAVWMKGFFMTGAELASILRIGIPSSITNIMQSIGMMLLNRFLLPYGNDKIAAMGIVSRVVMLVVMVMVSFSFGGQPLYGYLYGGKKFERMRSVLRFAYLLVCGLGTALALLFILLAPQMIRLMMNDAQIISIGTPMLRATLCGMPFIAIVMVTTCVFQSTGKASGAFALSAGRQGYIYAIVLVAASALFGYTGILFAQPVADVLTAGLAIVLRKIMLDKEISS